MPIHLSKLDEEFEQGLNNASKSIGRHVAQQSTATTNAIVRQLYGVTDSSEPADEESVKKETLVPDVNVPYQTPEQMEMMDLKKLHSQFPGIQNAQDQSEYTEAQRKLEEEKKKEIEKYRQHTDYYRQFIGTLDDRIKRRADQQKQEEEEEKQQEEQEKAEKEEQKKQQDEQDQQMFSRPKQNGRNRMGSKKGNMKIGELSVTRARNKAESFRGASG